MAARGVHIHNRFALNSLAELVHRLDEGALGARTANACPSSVRWCCAAAVRSGFLDGAWVRVWACDVARLECGVYFNSGPSEGLPLSFVANRGQSVARVRFVARTGGGSFFFFTRTEAVFLVRSWQARVRVALRFLGADPRVRLVPERRMPGRVNYLLRQRPGQVDDRLATYGGLVYRNLWRGSIWPSRGQRGTLKYVLRLRPGADPAVGCGGPMPERRAWRSPA